MVYGLRSVLEAIKSGEELSRVFVQKNLRGDLHKELMAALQATNIAVSRVPIERIHRFTKKNHQGVVALISPIKYQEIEHLVPFLFEQGKVPLLLVLDQVTDVRNFGAIARTAEGLGVHGMVISAKGGAQVTEDAMKTSTGAFNHLPVSRVNSLADTLSYLTQCGIKVVACTEKAEACVHQVDFKVPVALVMGSEELGISKEILALASEACKIQMEGQIASLNVSVAAGMALYEVQRQRAI